MPRKSVSFAELFAALFTSAALFAAPSAEPFAAPYATIFHSLITLLESMDIVVLVSTLLKP